MATASNPVANISSRSASGARSTATVPHHHVAILGSGFGGLGLAIKLLQAGETDFVVLEKAHDVGGTWRDNTYPGCQCDVASNMYSFSFAPNPNWSRSFAPQGEIWQYLRDCADNFGVRPHIRFGTELLEARWDESEQRYRIRTSQGELTADVVVSGHGGLSAPSTPEIRGLDKFRGKIFHSASWDHDYDLKGKRVAVIGTGASAIQIVPAIQPLVKHMTVFQRTPAWVVPRLDFEFSPLKRWMFKNLPLTQKLDRFRLYAFREMVVLGMQHPRRMKLVETYAKQHLDSQVKSPELRKKLTPTYALGCKRILLSNNYYPALASPNCEVVTSGIAEATETGVVTTDGQKHDVDALILATGFKVTNHPVLERLVGRDGRSLAQHWDDTGAQAYLGSTVSGFPNLFLLTGPNTGLGHNSIVYMLEAQFNYILGSLAALREKNAQCFDVKPEKVQEFADEMQAKLKNTVWSSGCASWYLDAKGRNTTVWPTFTWTYRARTKHFDVAAYVFEPKRERAPLRSVDAAE